MNQRSDRTGDLQRGFSLVEILVVVAIIAVLMALTVPMMTGMFARARRADMESQIQRLNNAVQVYNDHHRFPPGLFSEYDMLATSGSEQYLGQNIHTDFTNTENLTLALVGGAAEDATLATVMNSTKFSVSDMGKGPYVDGKRVEPYYRPRDGELVAVTGTAGSDNDIPEIVDANGMPILYSRMRGDPYPMDIRFGWYLDDREVDFKDNKPKDAHATHFRKLINDYIFTEALTGGGKTFDQKNNSMLSDAVHPDFYMTDEEKSTRKGPNNNLDMIMWDRSKSFKDNAPGKGVMLPRYGQQRLYLNGGWFLYGAGEDGIYMNRAQNRPDLNKNYAPGGDLEGWFKECDLVLQAWKDNGDQDPNNVEWSLYDDYFDDYSAWGGEMTTVGPDDTGMTATGLYD